MLGEIDEARKEMSSLRKQFSDNGWKETGGIDYVLAIISAREGDSSGVSSNLKLAIERDDDGDLKERLMNDVEFINFSDVVKSVMN